MQLLEQEMEAGLSPATHQTADVKMFPTYVRNIANGSETGEVLALDLGGTNFRVLLVTLDPSKEVKLTSKIFVIPQSIMLGEGKNVKQKKRKRKRKNFSLFNLVISSFSGLFVRIYEKRGFK